MNRSSAISLAILRPAWRAATLLGALLLGATGRRDAADRTWVARFRQPCDDVPVGSYVIEVADGKGDDVHGRLVVEASGCGPQAVDITTIVPDVDPQDPTPPVLRVWSVGADGVQSEAFEWVLIDPDPECLGQTRTERDGDVDDDRTADVTDAILIARYLFLAGTRPCSNAADANNDARVDLADVVHVLETLFGPGPDPAGLP